MKRVERNYLQIKEGKTTGIRRNDKKGLPQEENFFLRQSLINDWCARRDSNARPSV